MPRKNAAPTILTAAAHCLINGHGDFEMADVARQAKVSEGLAYHYYGSKAGLMKAIVEDFYQRYTAVMNQRYDGNIAWTVREKDRLGKVIGFLYEDALAPIILGKMSGSPEVIAAGAAGYAKTVELSARNIENGIRRGNISADIDPDIAGAAITGAVMNAVNLAMSATQPPAAEHMTEQLWRFITGALGLPYSSE